jgi:nitroreductase
MASVLVAACLLGGCGKEAAKMQASDAAGAALPATKIIANLVHHPTGAVGFSERAIAPDTLDAILGAVTPHAALSKWKLIAIQDRANRLRLLEAMQAAYSREGRTQWARTMERWKAAPVILAFCTPRDTDDFGGVPADVVRPMTFIEMGLGIQSLTLVARAHRIETHWIASALLIGDVIREQLGIPDTYELAFFGVAGYANEEIPEDFPSLQDICYKEAWGGRFPSDSGSGY